MHRYRATYERQFEADDDEAARQFARSVEGDADLVKLGKQDVYWAPVELTPPKEVS